MELWPEMLKYLCQCYLLAQLQVSIVLKAIILHHNDYCSSPADREADYITVKIAMTFGATISTQMATVPILNGSAVEFINLVLTSMDNAALVVNPATARINIEDSELTNCS